MCRSIPQRWVTSESHVVRLSAFHEKMVKPELLGEVIIPLKKVTEFSLFLYSTTWFKRPHHGSSKNGR